MSAVRLAVLATMATLTVATTAGCTSGSDAVPVPGADAVSTTPDGPIKSSSSTTATTTPVTTDTTPATTTPATTTSATAPGPSEAPPSTALPLPPATDPPVEVVYLRLGDEGDAVGSMQFKLAVLGYMQPGSDTGVFDEATDAGLRRFQADYGLGVDGVFGPLTGRSLNAATQSIAVEG